MTITPIEARRAFYGTKPREMRLAVKGVEVRSAEDGNGLTLTGYASVAGVPYAVTDFLGQYSEVIERGSFTKSLDERDDVRLLVNHDGIPIARTKSGTLQLSEDNTGLLVSASLDGDSPLVQTVRSAMDRGDLDEMSFAFQATRQDWNDDYTVRTIREVKLFDVSVVTYPANPATSAALRGKPVDDIVKRLKEGRALDAPDLNMLTQVLGWLTAIDNIVDQGQESLANYLGAPNPDADDADDAVEQNSAPVSAERRLALARAKASAL